MLNDAKARGAKPREKRYMLADNDGLHLDIMTSGKKIWRLRYMHDGKRKWYTLGEYPTLSIADARTRAANIRQRVRDSRVIDDLAIVDTRFKSIADLWTVDHDNKLSTEREKQRVRSRLNMHILPYIGEMEIANITSQVVLSLLRRLANDGKFEMMTRARSIVSQVFRFAAANGLPVSDPTTVLKGAITAPASKHYASQRDEDGVRRLMRAIDSYPRETMRLMMLFSAYTFCRPGEIRHAEWSEINFDKAEWRIPEEKMKMRRPHIVPLADQALELLRRMKYITGSGKYVFPSARSADGSRPISDMAVLAALRSMGFSKTEMTAHGFRSMASTILNEINPYLHSGADEHIISLSFQIIEGRVYNELEHIPTHYAMGRGGWAHSVTEFPQTPL